MIRKVVLFVVVLALTAVAGVKEPFRQFTDADFMNYSKPGQSWFPAHMFTLSVQAGSDVWLSNYVRSWYEPIADLHGNVYDMGASRYGYIYKDDMPYADIPNGTYDDRIHWASGDTDIITYTDGTHDNSATGYFLDYFDKDSEIYLVMTTLPEDGHEAVDTYQYVHDADNDTAMVSRQHNTHDLAGNVRINFGVDSVESGLIGREFVAVYDGTAWTRHVDESTGGPLPGMLLAGCIAFGTVEVARRRRSVV